MVSQFYCNERINLPAVYSKWKLQSIFNRSILDCCKEAPAGWKNWQHLFFLLHFALFICYSFPLNLIEISPASASLRWHSVVRVLNLSARRDIRWAVSALLNLTAHSSSTHLVPREPLVNTLCASLSCDYCTFVQLTKQQQEAISFLSKRWVFITGSKKAGFIDAFEFYIHF